MMLFLFVAGSVSGAARRGVYVLQGVPEAATGRALLPGDDKAAFTLKISDFTATTARVASLPFFIHGAFH
jgi:hypothetical protein